MPANVIAETNSIILDTGAGREFELRLGYDLNVLSGQPRVMLNVYLDGERVGTGIRVHVEDNRLKADLPGVNAEFFHTQDGHIAFS